MTAISQRGSDLVRVCQQGAAGALLVLLASCGVVGYVDAAAPVAPPPQISLAVSPTVAQRGEPLQLVAAITAGNGIDYVTFYRIDYGTPVVLGSVAQPPARWITSVPVNSGGSASYFARVHDVAGYYSDSPVVTVAVYP